MSSVSDFSNDDDSRDPTYLVPQIKRRRLFTYDDTNEDGPSCSNIFRGAQADLTDSSTLLESTSSESVKCSPRNLLFEHFFSITTKSNETKSKNNKTKVMAKCNNCNKLLSGTLHVTSNFLRHLRTQHKKKYDEYEAMVKVDKTAPRRQSLFDSLVLKFIAQNMFPVSVVESNSFKELLNFANPMLKVMSRPTAMKLMDTTFDTFKVKMKDIIRSGSFFCTTADIWSTKHRSFFGYTCHWLNKDFERKSTSLACKRFFGTHSFEAIGRIINNIHNEYGLNVSNLVATTTDNGSNFVKAFKEFGVLSEDNNEEEENMLDEELTDSSNRALELILPNHIRCATHTLNLVATTDFNQIIKSPNFMYEKHKQVLKKCSLLWAKVNRPKSSEQIVRSLGSQLKYPVPTRWNSLYDCIKDLLSHKFKLYDLCQKLNIEAFLDSDFEYLEEYLQLLQPIAEAIDFLQKDNGMFFGYLLPALATIKTKFAKIQLKDGSAYLKTMAAKLMEATRKRFNNFYTLDATAKTAIVASILCPQIKSLWLKALNPNFDIGTEADVIQMAKDAVQQMSNEDITSSVISESNVLNYFDFSICETPENTLCVNIPSESEFTAYFADSSKSLSMLNNYPTVKKAFLKYNVPLPSSAAVERLFSYASIINIPKRGNLLDDNFEKLLLLKVNDAF